METKDSKLEIKINDGEKKSDDKAIKILGWWVNQQMNLKTNLMKMKGIVNMKICQLKPYLQYMTMKQRKEIVYSKIGSTIMYGLPLYCGQNQQIRNDLSVLLMKINKTIFQGNTYKISNRKICKQIDVDLPDQLLKKATINLLHKMLTKKMTKSILKLLRTTRNNRRCTKLSLVNGFRTKRGERSVLYKAIKIYNSLPTFMKALSPNLMKERLTKIRSDEVSDD